MLLTLVSYVKGTDFNYFLPLQRSTDAVCEVRRFNFGEIRRDFPSEYDSTLIRMSASENFSNFLMIPRKHGKSSVVTSKNLRVVQHVHTYTFGL